MPLPKVTQWASFLSKLGIRKICLSSTNPTRVHVQKQCSHETFMHRLRPERFAALHTLRSLLLGACLNGTFLLKKENTSGRVPSAYAQKHLRAVFCQMKSWQLCGVLPAHKETCSIYSGVVGGPATIPQRTTSIVWSSLCSIAGKMCLCTP